MIEEYESYLKAIGRSAVVVDSSCRFMRRFILDYGEPRSMTLSELEMVIYKKGLKPRSHKNRYFHLKRFYNWLEKEGLLLSNPMTKIKPPELPKNLPSRIMTKGQTFRFLDCMPLDVNQPVVFRNRVMLEVLYAGSLRRSELVALKLVNFDPLGCTLSIERSKNYKARMIPIGPLVSKMILQYIEEVRPESKAVEIFLSKWGKPLRAQMVTEMVGKIKVDKLRVKPSSHSFRKSSATHMLRNGAPVPVCSGSFGAPSLIIDFALHESLPA